MASELLWAPVAGGILGLACVYAGLRAGRRRRTIDDTPTSKTHGVFIGDVELKGRAESAEPLTSYLAGKACVWYSWSVDEHWRRIVHETYTDEKGNVRTRTRVESGTITVASGGEQQPFHLRDDTGAVLVRPAGADVEAATVLSVTCGVGHPLYFGKGPGGAVPNSTFQRTFHESAIAVGQSLYVMGRARERSDRVAAEIAEDKRAQLYLISVRDESAISRGYAWGYWLWVLFGLALLLGGWAIYEHDQGWPDTQRWQWYLGWSAVYLGLLAGGWVWMVHNSIVGLRQRVRQGWANLDVQLKRRHDLLTQLVAVVQGLAAHEQEVQETLAALRAQAAIEARSASAEGLAGMAPRLVALREHYPRLVAHEGFLELQHELSSTEQRIALARSYYNDIATAYNTRLLVLPDRWAAALSGLRSEPLLVASDFERAAVEVLS